MAFPKNYLFPVPDQHFGDLGRALGHPARIYILKYLSVHGPTRFEQIVKATPLTDGTVTAHLRKLRKQGLVEVEEHGLVNIYLLSMEGIEHMFAQQIGLYMMLKEGLTDTLSQGRMADGTGIQSNSIEIPTSPA